MNGGRLAALAAVVVAAAAALLARQQRLRRELVEELAMAKQQLAQLELKGARSEVAESLREAPLSPRRLAKAIGKRLDKKNEEAEKPRQCQRFRAKEVTEETFYADFLQQDRPVIFKAGVKTMGRLRRWMDVRYIEKHYGDVQHEVVFPFNDLYAQPRDGMLESPFRQRMSLRMFIRRLRNTSSGNHSRMFIEQGPIWEREKVEEEREKHGKVDETEMFPMMRDVSLPHFALFLQGSLRIANFWMGSHGEEPKKSALHFDGSDNLLVQLIGRKRFVVFPALESHHVHPRRMTKYTRKRRYAADVDPAQIQRELVREEENETVDNFSPVLVDAPNTTRYPLYTGEDAIECMVKPGDVLYLPAFMWHNVYSTKNESQGVNIAVNLWFEPPDLLQKYHNVVHRILMDSNEGI